MHRHTQNDSTNTTAVTDRDRFQRLYEKPSRNPVEHGSDTDDPVHQSPADLTVTVDTTEERQTETTLVADDEPGIPPEDRDQMFDDGYATGESGTDSDSRLSSR